MDPGTPAVSAKPPTPPIRAPLRTPGTGGAVATVAERGGGPKPAGPRAVDARATLVPAQDASAAQLSEVDQFAYAASHDLQEPVRMVKGFLRLLLERKGASLDAEATSLVKDALEGAERVQLMLNDLLDYSRVETRGRRVAIVDLNKALDAALHNLRFAIQEATADVQWQRLPAVEGDEGQLTRLFQNLLANAVKFRGPAPPKIRIQVAKQGSQWDISVADNGIGIDPRHLGQLFQPFKRLHSADVYPGTGMGLAIARKIVDNHGGTIWLESGSGRGTTAHFTLPERR